MEQRDGTAMGSSLSVTYACLYMAHKEKLAIDLFMSGGLKSPKLYKRMVDDIAAIFTARTDAHIFMEILKTTVDNSIKFEYEINDDGMIFMDLELYKSVVNAAEGKHTLQSKMFQKPMNKFLFLPFQSQHPHHVFTAWITCYIKRVRLLCSEDEWYEYNKYCFKEQLLQRGYTTDFIDPLFAVEYHRQQLITEYIRKLNNKETKFKSESNGYQTAIKLTYNGFNLKILKRLKHCLKFTRQFKQDPHFKDIFGNRNTPMIIYETTTNISGLLIRSTIPTKQSSKH